MNSYATAVGNTMLAAQDYERRCQEAELRAHNARAQAERDARLPHPAPRTSRRGVGAVIGTMIVRVTARFAHAR